MKTVRLFPFGLLAVLLAPLAGRVAAAPKADLVPPEQRRPLVELAQRLAQPAMPPPLSGDLVHPFNPAAFGQPDPEELRAIAAAQAAAAQAAMASKPNSDSDFLREIASRVQPSGTLILGGEPLLIFGKKRLRVGDRFTVSYEGTDYSLDLVAIDHSTFTLRLNQEEITRPIKPPKSP